MNKQHVYLFSYIDNSGAFGNVHWAFEKRKITNKNLNEVRNYVNDTYKHGCVILSISYLGYLTKEEFEKE